MCEEKVWYLPVCNTNSPQLVYLLQGAVATARESLPLYYYSMVNVDLTQFYLFDRPDSHLQSATCKAKRRRERKQRKLDRCNEIHQKFRPCTTYLVSCCLWTSICLVFTHSFVCLFDWNYFHNFFVVFKINSFSISFGIFKREKNYWEFEHASARTHAFTHKCQSQSQFPWIGFGVKSELFFLHFHPTKSI